MGQKVNPIGLRLILNKKWQSRWYAGKKEFGSFLQEDLKIRAYLEKKLKNCAVAKIQNERPAKKAQPAKKRPAKKRWSVAKEQEYECESASDDSQSESSEEPESEEQEVML